MTTESADKPAAGGGGDFAPAADAAEPSAAVTADGIAEAGEEELDQYGRPVGRRVTLGETLQFLRSRLPGPAPKRRREPRAQTQAVTPYRIEPERCEARRCNCSRCNGTVYGAADGWHDNQHRGR